MDEQKKTEKMYTHNVCMLRLRRRIRGRELESSPYDHTCGENDADEKTASVSSCSCMLIPTYHSYVLNDCVDR